MKLTAMLAMTVAAGITVQAGQGKRESLTVYVLDNAKVPIQVKFESEMLASKMFASIGVRIDWHIGEPSASSSSEAVVIELVPETPNTKKPGALAYAKPFEGVHIVVFWDRMEHGPIPTQLLANVMVHEITHIAEGICHHSETGVMKANWTEEDFKTMKTHPLMFAAEDVDLIHRGLAARGS
jgi:hypothetical protein